MAPCKFCCAWHPRAIEGDGLTTPRPLAAFQTDKIGISMKTKEVWDSSPPSSIVCVSSTDYKGLVALWVAQQGRNATAHLTKAQARKVVKHLKRAIRECK